MVWYDPLSPQCQCAKLRGRRRKGAPPARPVVGVGADGVSEAVVLVPTQTVGDQITLTLMNDQGQPSGSRDQDGALGNLGDTTFSQNQVTVTSQSTNNGPYAFAVYRAPIDFARPSGGSFMSGQCGSVNNTDDQLACRQVSIQIQDSGANQGVALPVTILRPPVIMIHGLWSNWQAWNSFSPLVTGPMNADPRFYVGRVDYGSALIGASIISSTPIYPSYTKATAASLGFSYNASIVFPQITQWIGNFKNGQNPGNMPVAAVQADIVAHSMGGDITRMMPLQSNFLEDNNFKQGNIHKLITIDTPHLGSPLAINMLSPTETGGCLSGKLAKDGDFAFSSVTLAGAGSVSGAMADLEGEGITSNPQVDPQLSQALQLIARNGSHPLPTALVSGVYTDFASLDGPGKALIIRNVLCPHDPLAQKLTSTGWPAIFNISGDPNSGNNDAVVSETSQLNALDPGASFDQLFQALVHSASIEHLGFAPPSVLDPDAGVATWVIQLLNTPVNQAGAFTPLNP
jgi:PGAP1-like protein